MTAAAAQQHEGRGARAWRPSPSLVRGRRATPGPAPLLLGAGGRCLWVPDAKAAKCRASHARFPRKSWARYVDALTSIDDPVTGVYPLSAAYATARISCAQHRRGVTGSVGELGTLQGGFFTHLALGTHSGEALFVGDLFGTSGGAVDAHGGVGNFAAFSRNVDAFLGAGAGVDVYKGDNNALSAARLRRGAGRPFRLFSIDGDHSASGTLRDLRLISGHVEVGGVVMIDDISNPEWPGCSEGWRRFMSAPATRDVPTAAADIFPFALLGNKLFAARGKRHAAHYRDLLLKDPLFTVRYGMRKMPLFGGHKYMRHHGHRVDITTPAMRGSREYADWTIAVEGAMNRTHGEAGTKPFYWQGRRGLRAHYLRDPVARGCYRNYVMQRPCKC